MARFKLAGTVDGVRSYVEWIDGHFLPDSAGFRVLEIVRRRDLVPTTPTGPTYESAEIPAHVAFHTALLVFDTYTKVTAEGDALPEIDAAFLDDSAIPLDAVS